MWVRDQRSFGATGGFPVFTGPTKPLVLLLIEDIQRFVTQLRELGRPTRAAAYCLVLEDRANHVDLLTVVDLIPQRLQDFANLGAVGVATMHETRDVFET